MRKSGLDGDAIAECGNEIDPKVKAAPSVPIRLLQDAKHLNPPDDMLHRQPDPSELPVPGSLFVGERVVLAGLLRRPAERMLVLNTLIAGVGDEFGVRMDGDLRLPQEWASTTLKSKSGVSSSQEGFRRP